MCNYKKIFILVIATIINVALKAQSNTSANAEINKSIMTGEGKIYVVMAVVTVILAGLILYVLRLDRKITKLEKGESL